MMYTNLVGKPFCQMECKEQIPHGCEQILSFWMILFSWQKGEKNLCVVHNEHVVLSHFPLITSTQVSETNIKNIQQAFSCIYG